MPSWTSCRHIRTGDDRNHEEAVHAPSLAGTAPAIQARAPWQCPTTPCRASHPADPRGRVAFLSNMLRVILGLLAAAIAPACGTVGPCTR